MISKILGSFYPLKLLINFVLKKILGDFIKNEIDFNNVNLLFSSGAKFELFDLELNTFIINSKYLKGTFKMLEGKIGKFSITYNSNEKRLFVFIDNMYLNFIFHKGESNILDIDLKLAKENLIISNTEIERSLLLNIISSCMLNFELNIRLIVIKINHYTPGIYLINNPSFIICMKEIILKNENNMISNFNNDKKENENNTDDLNLNLDIFDEKKNNNENKNYFQFLRKKFFENLYFSIKIIFIRLNKNTNFDENNFIDILYKDDIFFEINHKDNIIILGKNKKALELRFEEKIFENGLESIIFKIIIDKINIIVNQIELNLIKIFLIYIKEIYSTSNLKIKDNTNPTNKSSKIKILLNIFEFELSILKIYSMKNNFKFIINDDKLDFFDNDLLRLNIANFLFDNCVNNKLSFSNLKISFFQYQNVSCNNSKIYESAICNSNIINSLMINNTSYEEFFVAEIKNLYITKNINDIDIIIDSLLFEVSNFICLELFNILYGLNSLIIILKNISKEKLKLFLYEEKYKNLNENTLTKTENDQNLFIKLNIKLFIINFKGLSTNNIQEYYDKYIEDIHNNSERYIYIKFEKSITMKIENLLINKSYLEMKTKEIIIDFKNFEIFYNNYIINEIKFNEENLILTVKGPIIFEILTNLKVNIKSINLQMEMYNKVNKFNSLFSLINFLKIEENNFYFVLFFYSQLKFNHKILIDKYLNLILGAEYKNDILFFYNKDEFVSKNLNININKIHLNINFNIDKLRLKIKFGIIGLKISNNIAKKIICEKYNNYLSKDLELYLKIDGIFCFCFLEKDIIIEKFIVFKSNKYNYIYNNKTIYDDFDKTIVKNTNNLPSILINLKLNNKEEFKFLNETNNEFFYLNNFEFLPNSINNYFEEKKKKGFSKSTIDITLEINHISLFPYIIYRNKTLHDLFFMNFGLINNKEIMNEYSQINYNFNDSNIEIISSKILVKSEEIYFFIQTDLFEFIISIEEINYNLFQYNNFLLLNIELIGLFFNFLKKPNHKINFPQIVLISLIEDFKNEASLKNSYGFVEICYLSKLIFKYTNNVNENKSDDYTLTLIDEYILNEKKISKREIDVNILYIEFNFCKDSLLEFINFITELKLNIGKKVISNQNNISYYESFYTEDELINKEILLNNYIFKIHQMKFYIFSGEDFHFTNEYCFDLNIKLKNQLDVINNIFLNGDLDYYELEDNDNKKNEKELNSKINENEQQNISINMVDDHFSKMINIKSKPFHEIRKIKVNIKDFSNYLVLNMIKLEVDFSFNENNFFNLNFLADIEDIEILDFIQLSKFKKIFSKVKEKSSSRTKIISFKCELEEKNKDHDYKIRTIVTYISLSVSDLNILISQLSLEFILSYFKYINDNLNNNIKNSNNLNVIEDEDNNKEPLEIISKRVTISKFLIKLSYKSQSFEINNLTKHYIELLNLTNISDMRIVFNSFSHYRDEDLIKIIPTIINFYLSDIKENQLPSLIKSLSFLKPLINILTSFSKIIIEPINFYKADKSLKDGLSFGLKKFITGLSIETIFIGEKTLYIIQKFIGIKDSTYLDKKSLYKRILYLSNKDKKEFDENFLKQ